MKDAAILERTFAEESDADTGKEYKGLCSTCRHRTECVYARAEMQPVVFCEEFEEERTPRVSRARSVPAQPANSPDTDPPLKGLCVNCVHRHDCVHEKPEGGVWHCEDYE